MKLGEFIKNFSHNNMVRLLHKDKGGHKLVSDNWDDVSMDWEINKSKGKFRHYIDNEVLGIVGILGAGKNYTEAINIVIEELENQPLVKDSVDEENKSCESLFNSYFEGIIKEEVKNSEQKDNLKQSW